MRLTSWVILALTVFLSVGLLAMFWSKEIKEAVNANLPDITLLRNGVPDFKKWPVEKEGNVDADNDGLVDFKLVYYLKEKEEAVALFVPFKRDPHLLIFGRYSADFFSFEDKIFYAVFENGRWQKVFTSDKRVEEEFKRLHIKAAPSILFLEAMLSGFNRRELEEPKDKKDGEKNGLGKRYRM